VPFLIILVGAVVMITAFRDTHGSLATALETDIPKFATWALAIVGVAAIGWVPGLRPISRWLLALVVVVLVVRNYDKLFPGFAALENLPAPAAAPIQPAAAYAANPRNPAITQASVEGTATGSNVNTIQPAAATTSPFGAFDPAAFLSAFEAGVGGFGGIA
jgi:hypothetical protein